ncbi:pyridoxal phosphate-dependent transferase [Aspergillus heterothallicus]
MDDESSRVDLCAIIKPAFSNDRSSALSLDLNAPLKDFRQQFHIPTRGSVSGSIDPITSAQPVIYLCGNQIGLQPRQVPFFNKEYLETWAMQGMYGLIRTVNRSTLPTWEVADRIAAELIAPIVGAKPQEVAVMGSLTSNLHVLLASFYRPHGKRTKIILEREAFSSDFSLTAKETLSLSTERILSLISEAPDLIALVLLSGVQYLTGQVLPMNCITVSWDLAHAVGNIELCLHDWGVDFAVWCNYKYMNAGPGAIGGIFVHERHGEVDRAKGIEGYRARLAGWWGSETINRFRMENNDGAAGFQLSNPSILNTVALIGSLRIFSATNMAKVRQQSTMLTGYLEYLLSKLDPRPFEIITTSDPQQRGAQLSLRFINEELLNRVVVALKERGIVVAQKGDVMRVAPVPLYNTFIEIWDFVDALKIILRP